MYRDRSGSSVRIACYRGGLVIGEIVGNFRIVRRLGRGGMGEVFLAEQQKIGTKVAIKVLLPELSADKAHVDRFFNEALAVSRIKHAGIVKIFDVGFHDNNGSAYLVMEFLDGESLAGRITRTGRLSLAAICDVGRQIASILEATHAEGVTHRDLKPDNVFLVPDAELASRERVKILDFGIAKLTGTLAGGSPKTMGVMGTPGYMAPEQWGDSAKVDWRADVYSLGCLAFEMACGRPPFVAQTFPEAYAKHLTEPPPPARSLVADLPAELEALLDHLLAKQPQDRPASMAEIAARFEAAGKAQPGALDRTMRHPPTHPGALEPHRASPRPPIATPSTTSQPATTLSGASGHVATDHVARPRSNKPLAIALGSIGVLGAGIAIYLATRSSDPKPEIARAVATQPARDAEADAGESHAPSLRQRIETSNPFVDDLGVKIQAHQISNLEYRWYLDSLGDAAVAAQPVDPAWNPKGAASDQPIAWVTFERARRFCEAIDAALPTDDQWQRVAAGAWGLDPGRRGVVGPLEEWTAKVVDGLATVRGGHSAMADDDKQLAMESAMQKPTESLAGAGASAKTVASAVIGFRCVR